MRAVDWPGTIRSRVAAPLVKPPSRPKKQRLSTPIRFASSIARNTFRDLPGGKSNKNISSLTQPPNLSSKHFVKMVVVTHSGQVFAIGGE